MTMRWMILATVLLSGCTASNILGNPVAQGTIQIATTGGCAQFAVSDPAAAKTTAVYLDNLGRTAEACAAAINATLVVPTPVQ